MFEQTSFLESKDSRKSYSIVLSLLLQIAIIGALCLIPFIFTQVLPMMQLKNVLAAPPKPPSVLKVRPSITHIATFAPRPLRLADLLIRVKPASVPAIQAAEPTPPTIGAADSNGVAFGASEGVLPELIPAPPPVITRAMSKTITLGGRVAAANLIHMVQPQYPQPARSSRIQGIVEFTATISKEGTIENLNLVRGHPLLINAAKEAVLQWRYRPTLLNGEPVEVITNIVVNFTLN
jgi:protein TonB